MCGRVTITTPAQAIAQELGLAGVRSALERPRYNLAPTQLLPVVTNSGERVLEAFRWGLVPSWAKEVAIGNKLINARSETVAEKPSFRSALKRRRCLIVVDGWYEWRQSSKPKTPYLFRRKDRRLLTLAGLWEVWKAPDTGEVLHTCTVLTTGPNRLVATVHDRMPVLLPPEAWPLWLSPEPQEASTLQPLFTPAPEEPLEAWEVSRLVNAPTQDVPACAEPVPGAEPLRVSGT